MTAPYLHVERDPSAVIRFSDASFTFHRVAQPAPTITLRQPAPTTRKSA